MAGGRINRIIERVAGDWDSLAEKNRAVGRSRRLWREFGELKMPLYSTHFAYYAFLAIFPMLLLITAVMSFVLHANPVLEVRLTRSVYELLPDFDRSFRTVLQFAEKYRYISLIIGLVVFLWAGVKAAGSLQSGFEVIYGTEKRSYAGRTAVSLGILVVFGSLSLLSTLVNFTSTEGLLSWMHVRIGTGWSIVASFSGFVLSLFLGFVMFGCVYRFVPGRLQGYKAILKGAALTAVVMEVVEYAFSFYFAFIYGAKFLYGTIGFLMGVIIWLNVLAVATFLGALYVRGEAGG